MFQPTTLTSTLMTTLLLSTLSRQVEQRLSSLKFASFLCLTSLCTMVWELLILSFFPAVVLVNSYTPLLTSITVLYLTHVPVLHKSIVHIPIVGVSVTEKGIPCLTLSVLMTQHGLSSALPCLLSLVASLLYVSKPFDGLRDRLIVGERVGRFVYKFGGFVFDEAPPVVMTARGVGVGGGAGGGAHRQQQQQQQQQQPQHIPPPFVPNPAAIATLMGLGFARDDVVRVLQTCDNNVEVAADRLLQG
jgi:hypothetical protein